MNKNIKIRPYLKTDYNDVKINLEEGNSFDSEMDTVEILNNKIKQNPQSVLVAEVDNKVIGNVYIIDDPWFAGIFRLAVRKEYRGQNIGQLLMKSAEKYLISKGHTQVMLFVDKTYDPLINWYKKLGFKHSKREFKAMWKIFDN